MIQTKENDFIYWNNKGFTLLTNAKAQKSKNLCQHSIACFENAISTHKIEKPLEHYYIAEANMNEAVLIYNTWFSKM